MLRAALSMLSKANFSMADVLIISDFEFSVPYSSTRDWMHQEHDKGTRFYGLQIGKAVNPYNGILDQIWKV